MKTKILYEMIGDLKNFLDSVKDEKKRTRFSKELEDLERRSEEFSIGLLAPFSSGKSTLINALIGKKRLPQEDESSTGAITKISKGINDSAIIYLKNNLNNMELKYLEDIQTLARKEFKEKYRETIDRKKLENMLEDKVINNSEFLEELTNKKEVKEKYIVIEKYIKSMNKEHIPIQFCDYKENRKRIINLESDESTDELKKLYKKYKILVRLNQKIKDEIKITLNDLNKYVESKFPCEIIEEIDIKLKDWKLDKSIKLIDLPGLDVINEDHKNITKNISKEVNAFIILEGEKPTEGEVLDIINNMMEESPGILEISYLVKNMYDKIEADKDHKGEKIKNFEKFRRRLGISKGKTFYLSAYEALKGKEKIYIEPFNEFKNKLISDSRGELKEEFTKVVNQVIKPIKNEILNQLKNDKNEINERFLEGIDDYMLKKSFEAFKDHEIENKNKIDKINGNFLLENTSTQWNIKNNKNILEAIEKNTKSEKEYKIRVLDQKDIHSICPRKLFLEYINSFEVNNILREKYYEFIEKDFYSEFKNFLKNEYLDENFTKYIPEKTLLKLQNYLEEEKIIERLNVLIDIVLADYSGFKGKTGMKFEFLHKILTDEKFHEENYDSNQSILSNYSEYIKLDKNIEKEDILNYYEVKDSKNEDVSLKIIIKEIETYLNDDITEMINKYSQIIKKNYLEDTKTRLIDIFNEEYYQVKFIKEFQEKEKRNIDEEFSKIDDKLENIKVWEKDINCNFKRLEKEVTA